MEKWKRSGRFHVGAEMALEKMSHPLTVREHEFQGGNSRVGWDQHEQSTRTGKLRTCLESQDMDLPAGQDAWMGAWDRKVDRWTECHSKSLDLLNGILEARGSILARWAIITIIYMLTICFHWVLDKMSKNRMFPACMGFRGRKMLNKHSSIKLNCHQAMEYYMVLWEACMGRFKIYPLQELKEGFPEDAGSCRKSGVN